MGFYDCRCMITGVSLRGSKAALIVLQPLENGYVPLTLAVSGEYDRYGSIDGIIEDENTRRILDYFRRQHDDGAFKLDDRYFLTDASQPLDEIESLLRSFERNLNFGPVAIFQGQSLVSGLICQRVVNALIQTAPPDDEVVQRTKAWFQATPVVAEIYGNDLTPLSGNLREFISVQTFMTDNKIAWLPDEEMGQHYEEMREYLNEARTKFRNSSSIQEALDAYEQDVRELLEMMTG